MNPWIFLGIGETNDKTQIKKAYAKMLKVYHPEDDPDGFIKLRAAYEEAMAQASRVIKKDTEEYEESNEFTEIIDMEASIVKTDYKEELKDSYHTAKENSLDTNDCFRKIVLLYNDVFKRISIECWYKLFLEMSIGELEQIRDRVVQFFNTNCCLPHQVWVFLDKEISLSDHENFIRSDLIQYDYGLSFDFINPDVECDYDNYARLRFLAFDCFGKGDYQAAAEAALQAEKLYNKDHVLFRIIGMSYYFMNETDKAIEAFSKALLLVGDDMDSLLYRGNVLIKKGDFLKAKMDFEKVLEIVPDSASASKGIVNCLIGLKKYKAAGKIIIGMQRKNMRDLELDILMSKLEELKMFGKIKNFFGNSTSCGKVKEETSIMKVILKYLIIILAIPVAAIVLKGYSTIVVVVLIILLNSRRRGR